MFRPLGFPSQIKRYYTYLLNQCLEIEQNCCGWRGEGSNSWAVWIPVVLNSGKNLPYSYLPCAGQASQKCSHL